MFPPCGIARPRCELEGWEGLAVVAAPWGAPHSRKLVERYFDARYGGRVREIAFD